MSYKINEAIKVYYRAVGAETGITDLTFVPTNPSGADQSPVSLTEVSGYNGLYSASFTPNAYGIWWIRVKSPTNPENVYAESYVVGENKISSIDNKIVTVTTDDNNNERLDTDGLIRQKVLASTSNDTSSNLAYNASFTGDGETTLGVVGIQVNFIADQNCRLQLQQSMDNVNWDIEDSWHEQAGKGNSRTVQATASYFRIIITNEALDGSSSTTYLREQVALCPIVECVPRALTDSGALKVNLSDFHNKDFNTHVDGDARLAINDGGVLLVGERFVDTPDKQKWNLYTSGNGSYTVNGGMELKTLSTPGDVAGISSKDVNTPVNLYFWKYHAGITFDSLPNNNTKSWGMVDTSHNNGVYFEITNGVFYAVTLKSGTPTKQNINVHKPTVNVFASCDIDFSNNEVYFWVNGEIVHIIKSHDIDPLFYGGNLRAGALNLNIGTSTTSTLKLWGISLSSLNQRGNIIQNKLGTSADVSESNHLLVEPHGSVKFKELFEDNSINTNKKWNVTVVTGGSKSVANTQLTMSVTTASLASIILNSKQELLYSSSYGYNNINFSINLGLETDTNNVREWGSKENNNGVYFRFTGTTLYGVCVKGGVETAITLPYQLDGRESHFSIHKRDTDSYLFFIDSIRVGCLYSDSSPIAPIKKDVPYLANYNTALATTALDLIISACTVVDPTKQSMNIMGIDPNGMYREISVDNDGRFLVNIPPSGDNIPTRLRFHKNTSAVASGQYQEILEYTVPEGYDFNAISFSGKSGVANEIARALEKVDFGSFVGSTNTFTDIASVTLPKFMSDIYLYVTTQIGSTSNDDITITYNNEHGDTGRTGTATIPKNTPVGSRIEIDLQEGDFGITDVTNVTHSETGQAGDFNIEGVISLFIETLKNSDTQYNSTVVGLGGVVILSGETLYLWYKANSAVSNDRDITMLGSLVPRT